MTPIRIELFGNLRITSGQQPIVSVNKNRLQSLLAFLVLNGDAAQSREHIAFILWPESNESQARTNLRQLLHNLRRALPAELSLLAADTQTVQWRRDPSCSIDVVEFEAAVARAADAEKRGDPATERRALEEAARLYQDDLLRGVYDEWLQPKREQLRESLAYVLRRLAALLEELGDYPAAIVHAERLVAQDSLREPHYQLLIRLHAQNHDRASALRAYHQCMRVLKRELGVDPGPATRSLFEQVLKAEAPAASHAHLPSSAATAPLPMIGRKQEWERLIECWRLVTRGEMRLALILGEPGIGKSRLAEELYRWCATHDGTVARARCYAARGQLAYAPIEDWLRADSLRTVRSQLPKPQLAELARVLPEILVENPDLQPPQPLAESWQRRHFYEALKATLDKARGPLLLLIDDLQWCDRDSFEWLHFLFRSEPAGRILVLGTVRPEETGRDHPLTGLVRDLQQAGTVVEVPLEALGMEDTSALAARVAGRELEPSYLKSLYGSTEGNPLFVVESVRAGVETPARIHAVISARLAQLSPPAYELAGVAGAIGKAFSFDLLAKATDWDEDSLSRALEELWQRRVIEGQGTGAYDFTHDRLREVAYAELSPVRRRFLHRRAARALEELHATEIESVSGQLAAHYEAAGMAGDAIRHYQSAAAVAQQRYADAESADLIRRALTLCRDFPETTRRNEQELGLLATLGPSLVATQGYGMTEVGETYGRALALCRQLGEKRHLSPVLSGAALFHVVRAQLETATELGEQLLELGEDEAMAGHTLLGGSLFHLGRFKSSQEHIASAWSAYSGRSHAPLKLMAGLDVGVFCRSYQSHILWQLGYADQAIARSGEAVELAREGSHPFSLALALDYAAMLYLFLQDAKTALARAEEAAVVCHKYGFTYYLAWVDIVAGWANAVEGDPASGLKQLRKGLDALKATGAELRLPFYHGLLAEVCGLAGQAGEARANVASGFAFQSKHGEIWAAPELHRIHGDLLLGSGDAVEARASYRRALDAARETGARLFELRAAARLCRLPGGMAESRSVLESIYRDLTEGFETPDLVDARSLLARNGGFTAARTL